MGATPGSRSGFTVHSSTRLSFVKHCRDPIDECQRCGGRVEFFGVIDYDDLNVPLYVEEAPRSLSIGDMRSLNVYLCRQCPTINYGITED
jgi:hypothetical protein